MDITTAVAVSLALMATFVVKQVLAFYHKLDQDSCLALSLQLQDPNSVKPLRCPSIWSEATKKLSIIIPAYNEQDRLPATLDETLTYLQRRRDKQGAVFTYEVIIVDDGSKDNTANVVMDYVRQHGVDAVRLLQLPYNCGKGKAVREGMLIARGELCLFMDADGATRVSDMELLEAAIKEVAAASFGNRKQITSSRATVSADSGGPLAIAVGSRAHLEKAAVAKRSALRNFLMHGFHFLVTFVAGHAVADTQCGFKMFTRRAAAAVYSNQRLQRWCFDVELLFIAQHLGIPIKEVQVTSDTAVLIEAAQLQSCFVKLDLYSAA